MVQCLRTILEIYPLVQEANNLSTHGATSDPVLMNFASAKTKTLDHNLMISLTILLCQLGFVPIPPLQYKVNYKEPSSI